MHFDHMPSHSRAWVYQSDRAFTASEQLELEGFFAAFTAQWTAHNKELKAEMHLLHHRFIVVMVDESHNDLSGCGIDKSVNFLKTIEKDFGVSLFNRLLTAYRKGDEVKSVPASQIPALLASGEIDEHTIIFNNMVQTKEEFDSKWMIPLKDSWLARYLKTSDAR